MNPLMRKLKLENIDRYETRAGRSPGKDKAGEAGSEPASNSASCTSSKAEAYWDLVLLIGDDLKFFANLMTIQHHRAKTC